MKLKTLISTVATGAILLSPLSASAFQVFMQDFENGINAGNEVIADSSTRTVNCGGNCPFSVTGKNWDVHHASTNPWAGGQNGGNTNPNISGQVLGHVYNPYDKWEDNYYQVNDIDLSLDWTDIGLMFDFDSWISSDVDGFAVSYRTNGGWNLLNPTSASDMTYRDLGSNDGSLNQLSGFNGGNCDGTNIGSNDVCGFDGHGAGAHMAGVAMFDLTGLAGNTIDLRFSFASDKSTGPKTCSNLSTTTSCKTEEGINIDNIKITAICVNGDPDPSCNGNPGTGVPEPSSIALMMLGATAVYRRRKHLQSS
ncbi:MAG: PEP-CTERM sorting domain-containing protein [Pseudomonadota bacterium]